MSKLLVKVFPCKSSNQDEISVLIDTINRELSSIFPNAIPKSFKYVSQIVDPDKHILTITLEVIDCNIYHKIDDALSKIVTGVS